MINYKAFLKAHELFPKTEYPFLIEQLERYVDRKPYKGLKILHNVPITLSTVIKIQALVLAGAQITLLPTSVVKAHEEAVAILNEAKLPVSTLAEVIKQDAYDIHMDCCGELVKLKPPLVGAVELTKTGSKIYQNTHLDYPVISVDDCSLKHIEARGTGVGFIDAIKKLTSKNLTNKKFMIFGYGKIGKGIAHALSDYTSNIIIIEKCNTRAREASSHHLEYLYVNDKPEIRKQLKDTYCVITATAVKNCISTYFDKKDFANIHLANMGSLDEFGNKFDSADILFNKLPVNFAVKEPTPLRYLDPVFYAHNQAIDLLIANAFKPGYNAFPEGISEKILNRWEKFHSEKATLI